MALPPRTVILGSPPSVSHKVDPIELADLLEGMTVNADQAIADAESAATSANTARIQAEAARDAAQSAVLADYTVADDTALAALTGMVSGETAYVVDEALIYIYDGSTWGSAFDPVAFKADKDDFDTLLRASFAAYQSIGAPGTDMDAGTGSTGGGTYCYSTPASQAGDAFTFTCYGTSAGTIDLRIMSKSGDVFTVEASRQLTVAIGVNTFEITEFPYSEGWYFGFTTVSGRLAIEAGTDGYYGAPGVVVDTGETFTDSTVSFVQFKTRFDLLEQVATGENVKATMDTVEQLVSSVGTIGVGINQIIGRPEGSALVTGSGIGGSYYIFEGAADIDRYLNTFSVWATAAGAIQVQAWSVDEAGDVTLERQVSLAVSIGLNEFTDVGLRVDQGERVGLFRGTGNIALTTDSENPTPYRSIGSTTGTPSSIVSTMRFEFTAVLEPNSLDDRISRLEGGDADANLLDTYTFHALWLLGESHCAGRAVDLSPAVIPNGKGYVYRRASGTMEHLQDPTGNDSTAISGDGRGSWGPRMGRMLLDMTKGAIGGAVINSGAGSTTIVNHWADGGSAWTTALADWADAKTEMDTMNLSLAGVSVMIAIGSNDASIATSKVDFKAAFIDLIDRVRSELGYNVPVLILPTGPFADNTFATEVAYIQDAQHEIAKEVANCRIVTTATEYAADNGWFMDNVHFIQEGNEAIGAAAGVTALSVGSGNSAR